MEDLEGLIVCTGLVGAIITVGCLNRSASNHMLKRIIEDRENDLNYINAIITNRMDDTDLILKFKRKQYPIPHKAPLGVPFAKKELQNQYFNIIEGIYSILYSNEKSIYA